MAAELELKLLLVEDSVTDAALIQANLRVGLASVSIERSERLADALAAVRRTTFSAVLLDLNLPDSSGVGTFTRLAAECNGTPIVVLSGVDDTETAIQAVAAGAEDYVQKSHYDAQTLSRSVRFAIERRARLTTETELLKVRTELKAAQVIQDTLYPRSAPIFPGMQIACGIRSAGTGCGDYYDFIPLNDGRQIIVVGDVSGHGMGSAIVMAETRASLQTLADVGAAPNRMLATMNRLICAGASNGMFVTLLLVIYDPATQSFEYFNAGHPGWVVSADDTVQLNTHQIPLGFAVDTEYVCGDCFTLSSGDILLLPTDGIQETIGANGLFGTNRLLETVRQLRQQSAQEIVDHLFDAAVRFSSRENLDDDMTAIVVKAL
ncbi:MAG: fused response regulator/phosphatase [Planctomycetaceae bacterium]